jgi:hypothetical protein
VGTLLRNLLDSYPTEEGQRSNWNHTKPHSVIPWKTVVLICTTLRASNTIQYNTIQYNTIQIPICLLFCISMNLVYHPKGKTHGGDRKQGNDKNVWNHRTWCNSTLEKTAHQKLHKYYWAGQTKGKSGGACTKKEIHIKVCL